jgi:MFS family permease
VKRSTRSAKPPARKSSAAQRDFRLLFAGRVVRAFGFGFAAILLGVHLQSRGLTSGEVGLVLAVGLAAGSLTGLVAAAAAGRYGRRQVLAATGVLMAVCGVDLAFATSTWLLVIAGLTGMMGVASTDLGPFLAVEQAVLAQTAPAQQRNRAFARYSLSGALAGAAGGLTAGAGSVSFRTPVFFLLFAVLGVATAIVPLLLSSGVEGEPDAPVFGSLRPLVWLSALFALDSLGGGLVVNSVLVYWLHIRFGAAPAVLGPAFAGMSVLAALSFELSGRIADRIGLVNTMVFTHLPSSLLLLTIPIAPALGWAIGILLVRAAVQSMDIPARQAYSVSIVKPAERSGALAFTGAVRGIAQSFGPAITGAAIQAAALGVPFLLAGSIKSAYDVALYVGFRRRFGDHEVGVGGTR